jgi:capsular exopolysaccharide synthesis family protein
MSENTLRFLDDRLALVSKDLSGIEKNLQNYKTSNDIVDLSAQGTFILNQLQDIDSKISELDVQKDVLDKIESYVRHRNNTNDQIPATLGVTDPVLNDLLNQLYQAEFELQKIKQISGIKNPKIPVIEETIEKLKPSIITSINNLKSGIEVSRQRLQSDNNGLNARLNKIPKKERQLIDISRQQGIKNGIYTFLLQKREEAAINAAGIVANYRILDKPETAGLVEPLPSKIIGIGIIISLILTLIFIYLKEFSSTRIKFRSQIEGRTKVPIIAEIAYQPNKNKSPVVVQEGKRTLVAEEFRELRTNLNYITFNSIEKSKVILITSSIPNEGKSFVTINTSISLSLTGAKVVLLEFDLRKPKISRELGITHAVGLSSYLVGSASENDIIQNYPGIDNLYVIPSGPIPPNPSELISSKKLNILFDYLKNDFGYIIIDSPPVGSVTDSKILAMVSDATLYIVRQNYTHSSFLDLVNDLKQKNILPNLNIVFNGIIVKTIPGYKYGSSYGYGGYGYGYGYGNTEENTKIGFIAKIKKWWRGLFP